MNDCTACNRATGESCCYTGGCVEGAGIPTPFMAVLQVLGWCGIVLMLLYAIGCVELNARIEGAREAFEAVADVPHFQKPNRQCFMNWVADPGKR